MRVVFYTAGETGSGHVILGISIGLGLRRLDPRIDFTVLNPSPVFGFLCDRVGIKHVELSRENEDILGPDRFQESCLFKEILIQRPDVLIVDLYWFTLDAMIDRLDCRKVFISRQVHPRFFQIPLLGRVLSFRPEAWNELVAIEPWDSPFPMRHIDPVILRNRDEILPREQALATMEVSGEKPVFMLAMNAHSGNFEEAKKMYSYLSDEGWDAVYTTNYHGGLFPAVDCFAGVDLLACGAGYSSFWESIYFEKETIYLPQKGRFENVWLRMEIGSDYVFKENGADTLARIIIGL